MQLSRAIFPAFRFSIKVSISKGSLHTKYKYPFEILTLTRWFSVAIHAILILFRISIYQCFNSICFLNVDFLMLISIELLEQVHSDVMYYNQILCTKCLYVFDEVQNAFINLPSSKKKQ